MDAGGGIVQPINSDQNIGYTKIITFRRKTNPHKVFRDQANLTMADLNVGVWGLAVYILFRLVPANSFAVTPALNDLGGFQVASTLHWRDD